jgi:hypothetical protein
MAMGVFAMVISKTHSTLLGTTNHLRQEKRAFAVSRRWLYLWHTPTQFHDITYQTYHCSLPYLAPSGQIHVIGAAAHACSNFGVEPTLGEYFVTLCTVGFTREGLVL